MAGTVSRLGLVGLTLLGGVFSVPATPQAQTLEIAPLTLDVAEDGLVNAISASSAAPTIGGLSASEATGLAIPVAAGLPQPSIILGRVAAGQEAAFGIETLLPDTVADLIFDLDDLDARDALRARDAALFRQLIEEGHLDPAAGDLNRRLQIELSRMNCYRSGIDGAWGPGSRRSVGEYFEELTSVSWPNEEPSVELHRAILINGDVACTTPVAQPTPQPQASQPRPAPQQTARPAPTPQPAPAEPAPSQPQLRDGVGLGIGVGR